MGEVYRARDAKLGRDVALKLLPSALASDAERLARFDREAKLLASLNHPGIAHLYGFETATLEDGTKVPVLVMELVEGEDLAASAEARGDPRGRGARDREAGGRGARGSPREGDRPPRPQARERQADAWRPGQGARLRPRQGLLGRRGDGLVEPTSRSRPRSRTRAPRRGLILGTAAYMSPEQARGKPVDRRADIWAFGVVLFEMLTGRKLFDGETITDVLASVVKEPIRLDSVPDATPLAVRRLLARCLERDPRRRLRDVGEARLALDGEDPGRRARHGGTRRRELVARAGVPVGDRGGGSRTRGLGVVANASRHPSHTAGRSPRRRVPAGCRADGGPAGRHRYSTRRLDDRSGRLQGRPATASSSGV